MNKKKTITFITGSFPPKVCGVGDYTAKLTEELKKDKTLDVKIFFRDKWQLKYFNTYRRDLKALSSTIYHLQYPTEGYGYSFLPMLLFMALPAKKRIVTVHELSSRNFAAYVYTTLLIILASRVIVSNELERKHASRFLVKKSKVKIIPIASNIAEANISNNSFEERDIDVAYFGHIRPLKGIEDFLKTKALLPAYLVCKIIGQSLNKYITFYDEVVKESAENNIEVVANREEAEISKMLARTKILLLPYPDGISNRRGTLLAGIQNGCIIVSRRSENEDFNDFFKEGCYLVDNNEESAKTITEILGNRIVHKTTKGLKVFFSWNSVVSKHIAVYETD